MIGIELKQTGQESSRGVIQSTQISFVCTLHWGTLFREQILCSEYLLVLNCLKQQSILFPYKSVSMFQPSLLFAITQNRLSDTQCLSGWTFLEKINIMCLPKKKIDLNISK